MSRIRLKYKCVTEIVGSDNQGILVLVNEEETLQVSIPCDRYTTYYFGLRDSATLNCSRFLPEVLVRLFKSETDMHFEIRIEDIRGGEYLSRIYNMKTLEMLPIQITDAVLLSRISGVPIYIDEVLMRKQSAEFHKDSHGLKLPINALSLDMLEKAMDQAVSEENYELASMLKEEIDHRKNNLQE
ncbi:UvrB/UvrC motif-containing protein [Prevotella sp. KH2C16]|uniref:UvrB/UvrC motif-containing protein n=1 Tax=Prevotella sp. KH2C16 TaxID=1855325 RepID=UPI0008E5C789|nr:UvrB/UvrC motif-containing protein [Prevotella sp. KH2C16]SFG09402.1 hypothetical protein SAMN05216383_10531 [Prevotella sp. KH2C16]